MEEADFDGKPGQALAVPTSGAADGRRGGARRRGRARRAHGRRPAPRRRRRARKRSPRSRRWRRRSSTSPTRPGSTGPKPRRRSPRASCSARTSSSSTRATRTRASSRTSCSAGRGGAGLQAALDRGAAIADAVVVGARHGERAVGREVAGRRSPAAARKLLRGKGVTVKVLIGRAARRPKALGGVLGVGQGSANPPRLREGHVLAAAVRREALALVGKGVVFDSGGLSLKTSSGMETMKTDMSGAAAVLGGDVGAEGPRGQDEGRRVRARWSRTCRAAPRSVPATC